MTAITCGWCGTYAHMTEVLNEAHSVDIDIVNVPREWAEEMIYECDNCHHLALESTYFDEMSFEDPDTGRNPNRIEWHPAPGIRKEFPDVPPEIADVAAEAFRCMDIGAFRAASAMARAAAEGAATTAGAEGKWLVDKIKDLSSKRLIRPVMADSAQEIREFGNFAVHGDDGDLTTPVTKEEAREALTFLEGLLNELFVHPAKTKRAKEDREAREAKAKTGKQKPLPATES